MTSDEDGLPRDAQPHRRRRRWRSFFGRNSASTDAPINDPMQDERGDLPERWSMGVLNDKATHEVPGTPPTGSSHLTRSLTVAFQDPFCYSLI
jgi:hypothetical protein